MKKITLHLIFLTLVNNSISAQCPTGNISLNSQTEVNSFLTNYPACTKISGNLTINGNTVTDLTPLSNLITVTGNIRIQDSDNLLSAQGLHNVDSIYGTLSYVSHNGMTNANAFSELLYLGNLTLSSSPSLTSSCTFNYLDSVGNVSIATCKNLISGPSFPALKNIHSFDMNNCDNLTQVASFGMPVKVYTILDVNNNDELISLVGLENITEIIGGIEITNNDKLSSLQGLSGLIRISGNVLIRNNDQLLSCNGLQNLKKINGTLVIEGNALLQNLSGLGDLMIINGNFEVRNNAMIGSLSGLATLDSIKGNVWLQSNSILQDLGGLQNVKAIVGTLTIQSNNALMSLSGIDNIDTSKLEAVYVNSNPSLSLCDVASICKFIDRPENIADFSSNATGCNSRTEVMFECFGLLPVNFVRTLCDEQGNIIIEVENEQNVKSYELIAIVNQNEIPLGSIHYSEDRKGKYRIHLKSNYQYDLYKIRQTDINGDVYYSDYFTCDLQNVEWDAIIMGSVLELKSKEIINWTITDHLGRRIMSGSMQTIDVSSLAKGIYYIKGDQGRVKKFMIN